MYRNELTIEVLLKAKELAGRKKIQPGRAAETMDERPLDPLSHMAQYFDPIGAITRVSWDLTCREAQSDIDEARDWAIRTLQRARGGLHAKLPISSWYDLKETRLTEVSALFDRAIEILRSSE